MKHRSNTDKNSISLCLICVSSVFDPWLKKNWEFETDMRNRPRKLLVVLIVVFAAAVLPFGFYEFRTWQAGVNAAAIV